MNGTMKDQDPMLRMGQLQRITERFVALAKSQGVKVNQLQVAVTVGLVDAVEPLDLDRLESFDDGNLAHDVGGILRHADAEGVLQDCFSPRCGGKKTSSTTCAEA